MSADLIDKLRDALKMADELELAGRPPGEIISITRQSLDAVLNDLGIVERLIRKLAER